MARSVSERGTESQHYALVMGVLSMEHLVGHRQRLRTQYYPLPPSVLVRFVLSDDRAGLLSEDEVSVPMGGARIMHRGGTEARLCQKRLVMARKAFGWWRLASNWTADFYAATDDDAIVDIAQALLLLRTVPDGAVYAGEMRYTCINASSLSGGSTHASSCFAHGPVGALQLRLGRRSCNCGFGPYPFALGPLKVLSAEAHSWVVPRLPLALHHTCPHDEDALLGYAVSAHPRLTLVDLQGTLGGFDVIFSPVRWAGPPSFLAHKVGTVPSFTLAARDLNESVRSHGGLASYCTRTPGGFTRHPRAIARQAKAQQAFCTAGRLRLPCEPWVGIFPALTGYPCCRDWTFCRTPPPLPYSTRFERG